jgi:AcrR family transcriptional regulator
MSIRGEETKMKILSVASKELAAKGPHSLQIHDLIEEIGVTQAMVNYHFGGRWGLIEAAVLDSYRMYVNQMIAVSESQKDALDAIASWAEAQVKWTTANPGIAVLLNFPNLTPEFDVVDSSVGDQLAVLGEQHVQHVTNLIQRAFQQNGDEIQDEDRLLLRTGMFMWTVLGLAIWQAGRHAPTNKQYKGVVPAVMEELRSLVRDWVISPAEVSSAGATSSKRK